VPSLPHCDMCRSGAVGHEHYIIIMCLALALVRDRFRFLFAFGTRSLHLFIWQQDLREVARYMSAHECFV
jgi:hypothetical protein